MADRHPLKGHGWWKFFVNMPFENAWALHNDPKVKEHQGHQHTFTGIAFKTWTFGLMRCRL